ncbi:MAG: hypothetical protein K6C12_11755 [Oscillospiraceae bacterium]|nr:hypothetical protein [Oscillospiraceae bacterium]
MTILVDMDDTIEQLLKAWLRAVNEQYHRNTACDDVTSWDLTAAYPGLTREQIYAIPSQPGFWKTVDPIPGAAEALQRLMAAGHEVYIVTATTFDTVSEKMNDLLFRYFPFLSPEQVIITSNKQMIRGDVLIDDGIHNLEGGDYVKILMTAPYNRSYDAEANGMIRVNNWAEIEEVLLRLTRS